MQKRIAVCIDDHPKTPVLLRAAQKKARDLNVPWVAIYVETPAFYSMDEEARERVLRFLTLAEQMGADTAQQEAKNALEGIVSYVEESMHGDWPIYYVIAGRVPREGLMRFLRPDLAQRLAARLRRNWEVHIIPLSNEHYTQNWWSLSRMGDIHIREMGFASVAVLAAYLAAEAIQRLLGVGDDVFYVYNVSLIFLVACIFTASYKGLFAGLFASVLSLFVVNYFYTAPLYNMRIETLYEAVNLILFFLSGLVISVMGSFTRAYAESAHRREKRTQALFNINRLTVNAQSRDEALRILHRTLTDLLEMEVAYFLPPMINPDAIAIAYPPGIELSEQSAKALQQCWKEMKVTGVGSPDRYETNWRFEPMVTAKGEIGVMGVNVPRKMKLEASFGRMLGALADHSAAIIERIELARSMEASRIREEREKLRSMLLSSVSHDLKTPLASVIGSLSVYHSMRGNLSEERQLMLTQTALDEAQRLDSFISNILDMTRLESGDVIFKKEWAEPIDLLMRVKKKMRSKLGQHRLDVQPLKERLEIEVDVMMTEQMLQNLLDNAIKYSPADGAIEIDMRREGDHFAFIIRDYGPGIPEDKQDTVFDKYSRLKLEDSRVAGTGLGLAISRTVMEAQGGTITVANHPEGGAVFTITFPNIRILDAQHDVKAG